MNRLKIFYFFLISTAIISSCDYVDLPYPEQAAQPASCDPPVFDSNTNTQRNVLVEDFTGHKCPNCPWGAAYLRGLQSTLESQGKTMIIVSYHATSLAVPENNPDNSYKTEFRTVEGDSLGERTNSIAEAFNITYVPVALVDRTVYGTSAVVEVGDWDQAINDQFSNPIGANLQMKVLYDQAFNKACIYVETEFLQNSGANFNLVIGIVEDSIIDWQYNGPAGDPDYPLSSDIENYVHRHVFRGNVNGTWGTQIATGGVTVGETNVTGFNLDIKPEWNPEHLSFFAYVYNESTKEIIQTIEEHLVP